MKKLYIITSLMFLSSVASAGEERESNLIGYLSETVRSLNHLNDRDLENRIKTRSALIGISLAQNCCRLSSIERKSYVFRPNQIIFNMRSTSDNSRFRFIVESNRYCKEIERAPLASDRINDGNQPGSNGTYVGEDSI